MRIAFGQSRSISFATSSRNAHCVSMLKKPQSPYPCRRAMSINSFAHGCPLSCAVLITKSAPIKASSRFMVDTNSISACSSFVSFLPILTIKSSLSWSMSISVSRQPCSLGVTQISRMIPPENCELPAPMIDMLIFFI